MSNRDCSDLTPRAAGTTAVGVNIAARLEGLAEQVAEARITSLTNCTATSPYGTIRRSEEVRFAPDSTLEQSGFELWVPPACDTPGSHKVRC